MVPFERSPLGGSMRVTRLNDILNELLIPFDYDEVFLNTLNRSYEFMKDGELIASFKAELKEEV
jgi:hypothetical protein